MTFQVTRALHILVLQQQKRYFSLVSGLYSVTHSVLSQADLVSEMLQQPEIRS